jgi:sortase (surface protein transpeptidase)
LNNASWRRQLRAAAATCALALVVAGCGAGASQDDARPSPTSRERSTSSAPEVPEIGTRSARLEDLVVEAPAAPTRIRIPDLGVDAPVIPVGVNDAGVVTLDNAEDVGWYRFGPAPGASAGSAVLAAHVDFNGKTGPFFRLRELGAGSLVEVDLDDGTMLAFRVVGIDQRSKGELPPEIFARTGAPQLTLITCGGSFDPAKRSYADNVIVIAAPEAR